MGGQSVHYDGHIGYAEALLLVVTALTVKVLLPYPAYMAQAAGQAGWMAVAASVVCATAGGLVLIGLLSHFPGRSLPEVLRQVTGEGPGLALNLVLVAALVVDAALVLRLFTETFIVAILPRTPPGALVTLALAVAVYAGYLGLEAICRTNLIVWPLMGLPFVGVLLLNLPQAQLDWLFPLWGPGPRAVLAAGVAGTGFLAESFLLGIYGRSLRSPEVLRRASLHGLWVAGAALTVTVALFVAVFGVQGAAQLPFPFFELARLVYLGRFFQRLEAMFVVFWVLGALIRLSIFLHAGATTLATALRLPYYRPLLFPLAVLLFGLSLVPPDFVTAFRLWQRFQQLYPLLFFLLPLTLLGLVRYRRLGEVGSGA